MPHQAYPPFEAFLAAPERTDETVHDLVEAMSPYLISAVQADSGVTFDVWSEPEEGGSSIWFWLSEAPDDRQDEFAVGFRTIDGSSDLIMLDGKLSSVLRSADIRECWQVAARRLRDCGRRAKNNFERLRVLRCLSLFSGMEAASQAIERLELNWEMVGFSEVDPAACAVLAYKFPSVKNYGDITKADFTDLAGKVDVIMGGSPCQSFSVAGKRLGLSDRRGNLALEYLNVVATVRPTWFLYENVPGLLASSKGQDFGTFLDAVDDIGYSAGWSVLNAKFAGVAQRRRRLFVVGYAGDWDAPARVLALGEGCAGDQIPRISSEKDAAAAVAGWIGRHDLDGDLLNRWKRAAVRRVTSTVTGGRGAALAQCERSRGVGSDRSRVAEWLEDDTNYTLCNPGAGGRANQNMVACIDFRNGRLSEDVAGTLQTKGNSLNSSGGVMQDFATFQQTDDGWLAVDGYNVALSDTQATMGSNCRIATGRNGVLENARRKLKKFEIMELPTPTRPTWIVRRLTTTECLRLQGFDDDWLDGVRLGGKPLSDSARYRLAGNSWAVPCAAWIIERIDAMDAAIKGGWAPGSEVGDDRGVAACDLELAS